MAGKTKNEPMCAVKIGYYTYLMPATAGMKLVQLLQQAVECEEHYEDAGYVYVAGDQVNVSYRNVRNGQIRMPSGSMTPARRSLPSLPRQLGFDD
ncbi:hypothetical protein [Fulvimonas yonginensis]|uniref:Uncharacterized protein n=1 Tax=Fulvimonas yonginensis TaxID=1495200 RepID=A0ABU8JBL3_9GAMM